MSNSQSSERPDLQDLVAYMQGRGSEALRAQVLKRLDEDESYLELMMDLVPMLREAGELADPDAAPDGAPAAPAAPDAAPRPLVSPIAATVDAPLPPIDASSAAPPSRVAPFPEAPNRRRNTAIALLAAMIPAAVAIWVATRSPAAIPDKLADSLPNVKMDALDAPWTPDVTRSAPTPGETCWDADGEGACFDAGAQMVDLAVALNQGSASKATLILDSLRNSLGEPLFEQYFPGLVPLPEGKTYDLKTLEKAVRAGKRALLEDQEALLGFEHGACLRAAVLAARTQHRQFFDGRRTRKLCLGLVGETNWNPNSKALEDLYSERRFDFDEGTLDLRPR